MKFITILIIFLCEVNFAMATQILPKDIVNHTIIINAPTTGEVGKTYFYCQNGNKCSTEQVVREYYKNKGYSVMRAEYDFWQGMFTLAFYDEIFSVNKYYYNDIPDDMFSKCFYENRKTGIESKNKLIQKTDLRQFINSQITKNEPFNTRLLYPIEIEGYNNPVEYFKSPIVQEFLARVDNKTFAKVVYKIAKYPGGNFRGTPDYIVWNKKELIFVEVKREREKLREDQISWAEFLIQNKIPYKVIRVQGK